MWKTMQVRSARVAMVNHFVSTATDVETAICTCLAFRWETPSCSSIPSGRALHNVYRYEGESIHSTGQTLSGSDEYLLRNLFIEFPVLKCSSSVADR